MITELLSITANEGIDEIGSLGYRIANDRHVSPRLRRLNSVGSFFSQSVHPLQSGHPEQKLTMVAARVSLVLLRMHLLMEILSSIRIK